MDEYTEVLNKYIALDGYNFDDNLKKIIYGLNLRESILSKVKILSGGEKIKVLLASLFLKNSDIMLLDEPTNNLDLEAIEWLENYLKKLKKKFIVVSHDEMFLNNVTNKVIEVHDGIITEYGMKYSDYLIKKEHDYIRRRDEYNNAINEKEKLKKQLEKAKRWASIGGSRKAFNDNDKMANDFAKERTNNSNISKISKSIEKLDIPYFEEKKPIQFLFNFESDKGNKNIEISNLVCGYDTFKTIPINISIKFGDKLEIIGPNGSGKTTFINTLLGINKPISGSILIGKEAKIGYISQDTLFNNNGETIIEYITKNLEDKNNSLIFTLLDKLNISFDDKNKLYNSLSPGERTRINLVKLALEKTNILILDEATNHLDREALELIYELITTYEGTIISISHNRKYNEIYDADIIYNIMNGEVNYKN